MLRREHSYSGGQTTEVLCANKLRSALAMEIFCAPKRGRCCRTGNLLASAAVAQYLSVFEVANRPEFRIFDLLIPWIFVISVLGFLAAWLVVAILERTGLSRHIWHLPLFFLALAVLLSSIIGFVCFP